MPNLEQLVRENLQAGYDAAERYRARDYDAINAIIKQGLPVENRIQIIRGWLRYYGVLRPFNNEVGDAIAIQIIAYADQRVRSNLENNQNHIVDEFRALSLLIAGAIPENPNGGIREVTSLVSKALWLCYPNDVPIIDKNAEKSLQVISRMLRLQIPPNLPRYASFVHAWFQVYGQIQKLLQANRPDANYPYDVRLFDFLLWYLGKDSFQL